MTLLLTGSTFLPRAQADVVFAWNEVLLHFSATSPSNLAPHLEARAYAMTHVAMHDAIATATRQTSNADGRLAAQRAATVSAARLVLATLLPERAQQFDVLAGRHLAAIPEGADKARGIAIGETVAGAILQRRKNDGWSELVMFNPPVGPEPEATRNPAAALIRGETPPRSPWLSVKPFVLKSAEQFEPVEPRVVQPDGEVRSDDTLRYSKLFDAIDPAVATEANRLFWSQRPLVAWNRIARQLAAAESLDLAAQARLLAGLNVALADATVAALHWRHTIGTWRVVNGDVWYTIPETVATAADVLARIDDGLGSAFVRHDVNRVLIPPMANYPSLSAAVAGAAQASLVAYFKTDEITFSLPQPEHVAVPTDPNDAIPHTFARISAAAKECAFVASLDGRHCRESCLSGYALGAAVGGYVSKRVTAASR